MISLQYLVIAGNCSHLNIRMKTDIHHFILTLSIQPLRRKQYQAIILHSSDENFVKLVSFCTQGFK